MLMKEHPPAIPTDALQGQSPSPRPRLRIEAGAQFGYRRSFWGRARERVLVEAHSLVLLEAGLHLVVAPNGSGKTTLVRSLAGLHPMLRGRLSVSGVVHYVSDQLQLDAELSPRKFFNAWFAGGMALDFCDHLVDRLGLDVHCAVGKLSRGNRQKVLLIVAETLAAVSGPSLLFLDEPLAGMDAETREVVAAFWAATSASVLRVVVLHELESVKKADSLFTLSHGQLRHTDQQTGSWTDTCRRLRNP